MQFPVELPSKFLEKARILKIEPTDIVEQFTHGSGSGGQKINKTSSTVLLRYLPTGTMARCQKYRQQSANRVSAYKNLILKIEEKIEGIKSKRAKKIFKLIKQKRKRSKKAKEKILRAKKLRGEIKALRGSSK